MRARTSTGSALRPPSAIVYGRAGASPTSESSTCRARRPADDAGPGCRRRPTRARRRLRSDQPSPCSWARLRADPFSHPRHRSRRPSNQRRRRSARAARRRAALAVGGARAGRRACPSVGLPAVRPDGRRHPRITDVELELGPYAAVPTAAAVTLRTNPTSFSNLRYRTLAAAGRRGPNARPKRAPHRRPRSAGDRDRPSISRACCTRAVLQEQIRPQRRARGGHGCGDPRAEIFAISLSRWTRDWKVRWLRRWGRGWSRRAR